MEPKQNEFPPGGQNVLSDNEGDPTKESEVSSKSGSPAWGNFTKIESGDKDKCHNCNKVVSIKSKSGTSTSTMLKHMRRCKKLIQSLMLK
ncbi:unnamed protein product [Arabis nemorensis]|uniref:BED-type domain-containing protein n=1 Tax=Arabis nemorensis TaxID=586526 RepID=A0A565CPA8_9BRAS|nr:unnamed protein product [Arabis nemorensis]